MAKFNIAEAKANLSSLVRKAMAGEEVLIANDNKPVAKLVPIRPTGNRVPGSARGLIRMAPDFDAPLSDFRDYS